MRTISGMHAGAPKPVGARGPDEFGAMEVFNRVHIESLLPMSRKLMRKDQEDVRIELARIVEAARVERPGRLQRPAAIRKLLVDAASRYCGHSPACRLRPTHNARAK